MPTWQTFLEIASFLTQLARGLSEKEGVDPVEFDRRVAELEAARGRAVDNIIEHLRELLG